jgi:hypothetical protein
MSSRIATLSLVLASALVINACGGGGGSAGTASTASTAPGVQTASVSSGAISAFGSVFVNGHEFATGGALVVDDDTGATGTSTAALEVGMVVDVKPAASSTDAAPVADEIHLHPLARGVVDAADPVASTLTVMGQTIQVSAATLFSDRRTCVTAATTPCAAVAGLAGLDATSGSGAAAVAGSFVTVHGYAFSGSGGTSAVATLVAVSDAAAANTSTRYKAEGPVVAVGAASVTLGALQVDLSHATCRAGGAVAACSTAFSVGQIVSVFGTTAPALPATQFSADGARSHGALPVTAAGATVEVEGRVASVTSSPPAFVVRGLAVDAAALPAGTALPAVGDTVEVKGLLSADGKSVSAGALTIEQFAHGQRYGLEGDATTVAAGSTVGTYTVTVLGQTVQVNARTRLADRNLGRSAATGFNIGTFQTYLAASSSQHLVVQASADPTTGQLTALALAIERVSTRARLSGPVDAGPAPVNSGASGTPSRFSVHGVPVAADPAAISSRPRSQTTTIAAGDEVLVVGSFSAGSLTVAAPTVSTAHPRSDADQVIDYGARGGRDNGCF